MEKMNKNISNYIESLQCRKVNIETDIDNLLDKYLSLSVNLKDKDNLKTEIINLMYDLK